MKRFTYRNKNTGRVVTSDTPLKDKNLVLVSALKDGSMKGSKAVRTK